MLFISERQYEKYTWQGQRDRGESGFEKFVFFVFPFWRLEILGFGCLLRSGPK